MDNRKRESRRHFLRLAATAAPAAAVAMTVSPSAAADVVQDAPKKSRGLRDTEHTRKYLESARF